MVRNLVLVKPFACPSQSQPLARVPSHRYGKGKRTGVYGSFLLAIYNPATEEFQTISKIGTGFSEEVLEAHARKLRELEIPAPRSYYRCTDLADRTSHLFQGQF